LSNGPATFAALRYSAQCDHVLFGTDWPYAPEPVTAASVAAARSLDVLRDDERAALQFGNAVKLFPRLQRTLDVATY
jgi:6-methylsalicylate decarboxylase